ncbi:hypothetical protein CPC08DRAFT_764597 [Agrocybe pediades]|nr:hypothetical protein CPC08DRAFT_764597 [Agrocybe pediades]
MTPSAHLLPPKTPASRLLDDILFMVFSLNTMQDDYFLNALDRPKDWPLDQEDALLTARRTSQVLNNSYPRAKDFFLNVVAGDYWERVECLYADVTFLDWTLPNGAMPDNENETIKSFEEELSSDPRWSFLCRPVPSLRIFNFDTCSISEFEKYFLDKNLLTDESNKSPQLRTMILDGLYLTPKSSFPNLRSLTIRNAVPTSSFLHALDNMPHLEELDLESLYDVSGYIDMEEKGKDVHLPFLKKLRFEGDDLDTADLLFNRITPAAGCILHCEIAERWYEDDSVTSFLTTLARYMGNTISTSNHLAKSPRLQLTATLQTLVAKIFLDNDLVFSLKFSNTYELEDLQTPNPPRIYAPSEEWDTTTGALCQLISTGADVLPASRYQALSLHVDRRLHGNATAYHALFHFQRVNKDQLQPVFPRLQRAIVNRKNSGKCACHELPETKEEQFGSVRVTRDAEEGAAKPDYMTHQTHQNFPARRSHQTPPRSSSFNNHNGF